MVDLTSSRRLAERVTEAQLACGEAERDEALYALLAKHPGAWIPAVPLVTAGCGNRSGPNACDAPTPRSASATQQRLAHTSDAPLPTAGRTIVFVNAISAVRRLAAILKLLGLPAQALHAGRRPRGVRCWRRACPPVRGGWQVGPRACGARLAEQPPACPAPAPPLPALGSNTAE